MSSLALRALALAVIAGALMPQPAALAQSRTWNGGNVGRTTNWTGGSGANAAANNWAGAVAPAAGNALFFAGTTGLSSNNNTAVGTSFSSISFNSGAGAFTIGGNALALSSGSALVNNSTSLQTINVAIAFTAATGTIAATSGNFTLAGVLSGTNLTFAGTNSTTLSGLNTYTGTTTIASGTVSASNIVVSTGASNLGNATSEVVLGDAANRGTLSYTGNSATYSRGFTVNAGGGRLDVTTAGQTLTVGTGNITGSGLFTVGGAGNVIVSSTISGVSGLTMAGNGTLTLSASNSFTGTTTLSAGALVLGNANALANSTLSTGSGGLSFGSLTAATLGGLVGSSNLALSNTASQAVTLSVGANNGSTTYSGTLSGAGSLVKVGSGTFTLSGISSFSGTTSVNAGAISIASVAGGAGNQPLGTGSTLNLGVASTSSGRLVYTGSSGTLSKNVFALGNGTDTIENAGTGLLTLSGTLTKNGTVLRLQGGSAGITVTGLIVGALANSDLAVQNGLTTLAATNTYTGPTFINSSGTLALGIANAIPSNSAVTIGGTLAGGDGGPGVLSMGSLTNAIGSLAFSGSGGTIKMAPTASATSTVVLSATGAVNLSGTSTLDLAGMATGAGLYRLIAGSSLTGQFSSTTGLDGNYVLRYGTVNANSVDAQRKADQATTFTMTTGAVTRALVNTSVALSGTITNTSPVLSTALSLGLGSTGQLTVANFTTGSVTANSSSAVSGTIAAGATAGSRTWTVVNTDNGAITTTSTATGSLTVVDQRVFTTSTSTLALGFVHQGGTFSTPSVVISSTGLNATTANATIGSFTGGPGGFTLGRTSGTNVFAGGSSPQSTTYTLTGSTASLGAISGTYSSSVTAEFGSINAITVAVSGSVYSGQSTWATNGGGAWGTFASGFGSNWGANQGSPGLDGSFAATDTATFGSALTSGTAVILLNGAAPSLKGLTFNNAAGLYDLDVGTGGTGRVTLAAGGTAATIDVLAGFHEIHTELQLGSNLAVSVAAASGLTLHGDIAGSTYALTKTGAGLLVVRGNNSYSGGTLISGGTLALGNSVSPLGSGAVVLTNNATLDLRGFTIGNTIDATNGFILNPGAANIDITGTTTVSSTGAITGIYTITSSGSGTFSSPLGNPAGLGGTITVQGGGRLVTTSTITSAGTVLVNSGGQATLSGPVDGTVTTAGLTTFASGLANLADVTVNGGTATFQGTTLGDVNVDLSGTNTGGASAIFTGTIAKTAHAYASGTITILGAVAATADVKSEAGGVVNVLGSGAFAQTAMTNNGLLTIDRTASLLMATAISGSGSLRKLGTGVLELTGANTFTGPTALDAGTLLVNGTLSSGVASTTDTTLGGSGSIAGTLSGAGLVSPGNSPGILTAGVFDPTGGLDAAFEFTAFAPNYAVSGTGALNDVLRLTGATPFDGSPLTAANVIDIYLNRATVNFGDQFEGGFYAEQFTPEQLLAAVENATFVGWVRTDGPGTRIFGGLNYNPISYTPGLTRVQVGTKAGPGSVGAVTTIQAVPEPGSLALAACGLGCLAVVAQRRRRRRAAQASGVEKAVGDER